MGSASGSDCVQSEAVACMLYIKLDSMLTTFQMIYISLQKLCVNLFSHDNTYYNVPCNVNFSWSNEVM
jgi:hypothetical protein